MWFQSWEAVKAFAGEDWERSVVPPAARAVLARFDERGAALRGAGAGPNP